jgi:hypothetical protein
MRMPPKRLVQVRIMWMSPWIQITPPQYDHFLFLVKQTILLNTYFNHWIPYKIYDSPLTFYKWYKFTCVQLIILLLHKTKINCLCPVLPPPFSTSRYRKSSVSHNMPCHLQYLKILINYQACFWRCCLYQKVISMFLLQRKMLSLRRLVPLGLRRKLINVSKNKCKNN